jgi:hypothetical protein
MRFSILGLSATMLAALFASPTIRRVSGVQAADDRGKSGSLY